MKNILMYMESYALGKLSFEDTKNFKSTFRGIDIPLHGTYNQNEMYKKIVSIINNY